MERRKKMKNDISKKNKYWISKERYLELVHFCLQYPEWISERIYVAFNPVRTSLTMSEVKQKPVVDDLTMEQLTTLAILDQNIAMVEVVANEADPTLFPYIMQSITRGLSYESINAFERVPCSRNVFYDTRRKFFWLLDRRLRQVSTQEA